MNVNDLENIIKSIIRSDHDDITVYVSTILMKEFNELPFIISKKQEEDHYDYTVMWKSKVKNIRVKFFEGNEDDEYDLYFVPTSFEDKIDRVIKSKYKLPLHLIVTGLSYIYSQTGKN